MKMLRLLTVTAALLVALLGALTSLHAIAAAPGHAAVLHDPTRPLAAPARKASAETQTASTPSRLPQLQMVLISEQPGENRGEQRRLALIDDELVAEGETFKGLRVLSIRKEAVILATPHGPRTLPLAADAE